MARPVWDLLQETLARAWPTIPLGSQRLLSAQKADGDWLCALICVTQAR